MKKIKMGLVFLLFIVSVLSGCSSKEGAGESEDGVVTLKIMSVSQTEQPDGELEQKIADEYMKQNPKVKIEFIGVPMNDLYKKLTTLATSNDLPDAFTMTPEFMRTAHDMGMTANLTELLGEEYLKDFYENIIDEASINGELQLIPWNATPQALIFRGDWFEEEGLEAPKTWDEFIEVAQKLTKDKDGDGQVDQWGFGLVGTRNGSGASRFIPILRSFGAAEIRKDNNGNWITDLGSDEAKKAFQLYGDLNNKYKVVPPGVTESGFPEVASLFATNKVAMMITGPNALGAIYAENPDLKGKVYSTPVPKDIEYSSNFGLIGYGISENSEHKEEVADYLKFLVNKENSLQWNKDTGRLPTRKDVGESQQLNTPEMAGYSEAITYAFHLPEISSYSQFQDIIAEAYQTMLTNSESVENIVKKAENRAEDLISKE
ncbi:sugar ABC transporter substrate-binding protein [Niallia sp.]|uniref:ABC transporter substrate-binding protein n=1 Tax=Niallia sp. TaxID=2837523 RepID=UPI00289C991F|nr:sugar ABC transporter substrate-binding protein [Niallia sp.]